MNFTVDKDKAIKKWNPVMESLGVADVDKKEWMAEYAQRHQMNEQVAYSTLTNLNGMGNVTAPQPGQTPGAYGTSGSGDVAQNLLPVSMKIAAQTIGLDLVAVKPTSSPRIELLFVDFKYDNNDQNQELGERPLVFKAEATADFKTTMKTYMDAHGVREDIGGLRGGKVFYKYTKGTIAAQPEENKEGWLEFLGYSRVDGFPIFRTFRKVAPFTQNALNKADFTFDPGVPTSVSELIGVAVVDTDKAAFVTSGTPKMAKVELVSLLEDQLPGFVADWNQENPMNRADDEKTYPGVVGPDIFTKSVQVGDIEISSSVKRTQMEDIKAATGMDIVQKLESVLINELTQTISKQIVAKVRELGEKNKESHTTPKHNGVSDFDFNVDKYIGSTGFGPAPGGETTHSIQRKLIAKINFASGYIATEGRVGPAQYLVTNTRLAAVIQDVAGYTINPVPGMGKLNTNGQLYPMGTVGGIQIYVDPYMRPDDNRIFLGRKNTVDQPGLLFIPYLMAQSISLISEATFAPRMLIRSRYAITEIGFFPEKQFMSMLVTDTNNVLI